MRYLTEGQPTNREDQLSVEQLLREPLIERETLRANSIRLLAHPAVKHVFLGVVEGEEVIRIPDPDEPDTTTLMTICRLRVVRPFRGTLNGERVDVLYNGGYVNDDDYLLWAHGARCSFDDLQLVVTYSKGGVLRASERGTVSLVGEMNEQSMEGHPFVEALAAAAITAGVMP